MLLKNHDNPCFTMRLSVDEESAEGVANYLFELGALGIETRDEEIIATFPSQYVPELLSEKLKQYLIGLRELGFITPDEISIEKVANRDWNAEWKKKLKPFRVSRRLMIKPSWRKSSKNQQIQIDIDPQMAFGTGSHATTRMVLQFLDERIRGGELVADVGTGTGILAIAAIKLGASKAIAFDIDPIAAKTARMNCILNKTSHQIDIFAGSLAAVQGNKFDIILANLSFAEISQILSEIPNKLSQSGLVIFSGLLQQEEMKITQLLKQQRFLVLRKKTKKEWLAILASLLS